MSIVGDLIKLYELWKSSRGNRPSAAEKELIVRSLPTGTIQVLSTDQIGKFVRTGNRDYLDSNDAGVQAAALEALEKLSERGWLRQESEVLFKLSGTGLKYAREFVSAA